MNCATYQRWFSPYVDALLAQNERDELEAHLNGCPRCRADLESLQAMLRSLRALEPPETPELLPGIQARLTREPWWQRLARRFLAPWPASLPLHGVALATTALLVIVVVGLPRSYQAPRTGLMQLASKPSDEISAQFVRQDDATSNSRQAAGPGSHSVRGSAPAAQRAAVRSADFLAPPDASQSEASGDRARSKIRRAAHRTARHPLREGSSTEQQDDKPFYREVGNDTENKPQVAAFLGSSTVENANLTVNAPAQPVLEQEASKPVPEALAISEQAAEPLSVSSAVEEADEALVGAASLLGSAAGTAETCPPCEKKRAELARQWEEHPQVQWHVNDLASAAAQLNGWVQSKGGSVTTIDEHRLSVTLPEASVSEFLTQFSSSVSAPATISLDAPPDSTQWVTISLELISPE